MKNLAGQLLGKESWKKRKAAAEKRGLTASQYMSEVRRAGLTKKKKKDVKKLSTSTNV